MSKPAFEERDDENMIDELIEEEGMTFEQAEAALKKIKQYLDDKNTGI
jgi:hypothetical protein